MEKVTRTLATCEELFEVITVAHKRNSNIQVYLQNEIPEAANEAKEMAPVMETRKVRGDLDYCLLLSLRIPGQEEMKFDVDSTLNGIYKLSVDFSRETDYCGVY